MRIPKTIREVVIEDAHDRTKKQNQDCMLVGLGPRGNGKTTSLMQIQDEYNPPFGLDKIGWEFEEHRDKLLLELPRGSNYHADEIRFHSMDFRTNAGIECDKLLTEIRPFNHFTTWSSVRIHKILGTFLEFAHYLFYFYGVGKCVVLKRNDNILKGNAFGINMKDIEKITNPKTFEKYFVRPAKKNKLYVGKFQFPKYTDGIDKKFYDAYEVLRLKSTKDRFVKEKKTVTKLPPEIRRPIVKRGTMVRVTYEKMSAMLGVSMQTIAGDVKYNKQSGDD